MSTNRLMMTILLAGFMALTAPVAAAQDGAVTLQALMIQAQNEPAPRDARLESVEVRLRRVFGFMHYRYVGEGRVTLSPGGEGSIQLPQGHRLRIRLGRGGRAEVRWYQNEDALLSTGVGISRDAPVVLGGVPSGSGKLILVLTEQ